MSQILQGTCLSCHRLYVSDVEGSLFVHRMKLLEQGNVVGSKALQQFVWQYQAEKGEDRDTFAEDLLVKLKQMAKELIKGQWFFFSSCLLLVLAAPVVPVETKP